MAIGSVLMPLVAVFRSLLTFTSRSQLRSEEMYAAGVASKEGQNQEDSAKWMLRYALAMLIARTCVVVFFGITITAALVLLFWHPLAMVAA